MSDCIGEALPEQIARFILEKIIDGTFKPGEKIVEEKISSALNVSRAPVREALYLLQVDGLVERIPRRGTIVCDFNQKELIEAGLIFVGLTQRAIELSIDKWECCHSRIWAAYQENLQKEYENKSIIGYSENLEKILRYLFLLTESKILLKYFCETNYILNVFSRVTWTIETMEEFHQDFKLFCHAVLEADVEHAKKYIQRALIAGIQ